MGLLRQNPYVIARLTGKVIEREEKALVVETGGVGYRVAVLSATREKMNVGEKVELRIYHQTNQDAENLYGFETAEQLKYFELLLTVPSVGPKTALGILEIAPPRVLEQAVAGHDVTLLTKVSGVGRKTAERILVELKGKVKAKQAGGISGAMQQETIEALISIGFSPAHAREAVRRLPKEVTTVEEAVRAALKEKVR